MDSVMYSSEDMDWETPQWFVDLVEEVYGYQFDLDACAKDERVAKAPLWIPPEEDALTNDWFGTVWMNPPYGRSIPKWMEYAYQQSRRSEVDAIVCLVPARTDTQWFHTAARRGSVDLMEKRLPFLKGGEKVGSPAFPSCLIVFDKSVHTRVIDTWDWKSDLALQ